MWWVEICERAFTCNSKKKKLSSIYTIRFFRFIYLNIKTSIFWVRQNIIYRVMKTHGMQVYQPHLHLSFVKQNIIYWAIKIYGMQFYQLCLLVNNFLKSQSLLLLYLVSVRWDACNPRDPEVHNRDTEASLLHEWIQEAPQTTVNMDRNVVLQSKL